MPNDVPGVGKFSKMRPTPANVRRSRGAFFVERRSKDRNSFESFSSFACS